MQIGGNTEKTKMQKEKYTTGKKELGLCLVAVGHNPVKEED